MKLERVELQLKAALSHPDAIIGSKFSRCTPQTDKTTTVQQWMNFMLYAQDSEGIYGAVQTMVQFSH